MRQSVGPHAVAPGWWWESSLAVRDGYLRMFLSEKDAREWAARHGWIEHAHRPDPWPGKRNHQPDIDYQP